MSDDYSDRLSDISLETDNKSIRNTNNTEIENVNIENQTNWSCFIYCNRCYYCLYWLITRNIDEK